MSDGGTVLVTGGASGLGAAVVVEVEKQGWRPHVLDIAQPSDDVAYTRVDLADTASAEEAAYAVADEAERMRAVVTCAAIDEPADFAETTRQTWERIVTVNLLGTAAVIRGALPALVRDSGTIVTVASTLGMRALPAASAYSASKFGVVGMTRALALELGGTVGVTLLVPGGMRTNFFEGRTEQFKPGPDQKLNDPADVARSVIFALSQPEHCEIREMVITPSVEPSWP